MKENKIENILTEDKPCNRLMDMPVVDAIMIISVFSKILHGVFHSFRYSDFIDCKDMPAFAEAFAKLSKEKQIFYIRDAFFLTWDAQDKNFLSKLFSERDFLGQPKEVEKITIEDIKSIGERLFNMHMDCMSLNGFFLT